MTERVLVTVFVPPSSFLLLLQVWWLLTLLFIVRFKIFARRNSVSLWLLPHQPKVHRLIMHDSVQGDVSSSLNCPTNFLIRITVKKAMSVVESGLFCWRENQFFNTITMVGIEEINFEVKETIQLLWEIWKFVHWNKTTRIYREIRSSNSQY